MEWLDENSYPKLRLDHGGIELTYQPTAVDAVPGPVIVKFKAECIASHSAGKLIYTADNLSFMPEAFTAFASDLKEVLDGRVEEATLSPIGSELVLVMKRVQKEVWMQVAIHEWQVSYPAMTASATDGVGVDVAYRWARELKDEYAQRLNDWMLGRAC